MKKIKLFLAAAVIISAFSGCANNSGEASQTTAGGESGGQVTQVALGNPEKEDTTDEAVEFLKTKVPLFSRYLETRMQYPLTYEVEIEADGAAPVKSGIYIRDDKSLCVAVEDAEGNTQRELYLEDTYYFIDDKEKVVYSMEYSEDGCKEAVGYYLLKIDLEEAQKCSYVDDFDTFRDVIYKHEIIYAEDYSQTDYFYDENTEELVYVVSGTTVTKVLKLANENTDSVFEIPADYTQSTLEEYAAKIAEEQSAETAAE